MTKGDVPKEERLGDLLIRRKLISPAQLDQAVKCQVLFGGRLGTNLLELGFISENQLRRLLEEKYDLPSVSRDNLRHLMNEVISLIPPGLARLHMAIPMKVSDDHMEVAMLDPWRESSIETLSELTSLRVKPMIALELDICWALEKYYGIKREARFQNMDRWFLTKSKDRKLPPVKKNSNAYRAEPILPPVQDITSAEGAPCSLDDFWDRVGRTGYPEYLLPRIKTELEGTQNRDEVAKLIMDSAAMVFNRSLLFVVNEDMLFGWDGRGEGIDSRVALSIMLPLSRPSVFKTVVETGSYSLGPIPETSINRRFLAALGEARPRTALLLPILISGRVAAILYGDMGHEQEVSARLSSLQTVLAYAAVAFQRLIVRQKADNPEPPAKSPDKT